MLRPAGNGDQLPDGVQGLGTDAGNIVHVVNRVEGAVILAVNDNSVRQRRADPGQRLQFAGGRGVQVNLSVALPGVCRRNVSDGRGSPMAGTW